MQVGDQVEGGIYAGIVDGHLIICPPIEYELPFQVNWHQAKEYSKALSMELPTKKELNLLFKLYKVRPEYFPSRKQPWYWSSTEGSSLYAWTHNFIHGIQSPNLKTAHDYACLIRRIKIES